MTGGTRENINPEGRPDCQTQITCAGKTFWADNKMVPLLVALNDAGLETRSHCSGHSDDPKAWVAIRMASIVGVEVRHDEPYDELLITWKPEVFGDDNTREGT